MRRADLEHLIRAAADVAGGDKADLDELREIHGELPIDPLPGVDS